LYNGAKSAHLAEFVATRGGSELELHRWNQRKGNWNGSSSIGIRGEEIGMGAPASEPEGKELELTCTNSNSVRLNWQPVVHYPSGLG